jgi:hypothetical protein
VRHIEDGQYTQVEDTGAERIADGDIGRRRDSDSADAGEQFRQRCGDREQQKPDPASRKASPKRDDLAIARQGRPAKSDQRNADRELHPRYWHAILA